MSTAPQMIPPALVLVAEDDEEMRELITRALRRDGYEVLAARDGSALFSAVSALRAAGREPDLVVSDVRMPHLGGLELTRRIRAEGCDAPIVLVSAFADERTIGRARGLGAAHVLSKPFDLDDLRTVVMFELRRGAQ